MMDFRDDIEEFWEKYSWLILLVGSLYFAGHIVYYFVRRFLYV
jgi:hypothetical protein